MNPGMDGVQGQPLLYLLEGEEHENLRYKQGPWHGKRTGTYLCYGVEIRTVLSSKTNALHRPSQRSSVDRGNVVLQSQSHV